MLAKMNSKSGVWTFGGWNDSFNLFWTDNERINNNQNSYNSRLILLNELGNSEFPRFIKCKRRRNFCKWCNI